MEVMVMAMFRGTQQLIQGGPRCTFPDEAEMLQSLWDKFKKWKCDKDNTESDIMQKLADRIERLERQQEKMLAVLKVVLDKELTR